MGGTAVDAVAKHALPAPFVSTTSLLRWAVTEVENNLVSQTNRVGQNRIWVLCIRILHINRIWKILTFFYLNLGGGGKS